MQAGVNMRKFSEIRKMNRKHGSFAAGWKLQSVKLATRNVDA